MPDGVEKVPVKVRVNGKQHELVVEPRLLLVELLREVLDLTGTHVGCDTTDCGACTVLMNGAAVKSFTIPFRKLSATRTDYSVAIARLGC